MGGWLGGMGGWLGGMGGWLGRKTWHFFRFLARRYAPAPKIEKNALKIAAEFRRKLSPQIRPKFRGSENGLENYLELGLLEFYCFLGTGAKEIGKLANWQI